MGLWLKQSTAADFLAGPFVDEDDGKTLETALTITSAEVRLSKNGGNMAAKNEATALAHDELGMYVCKLDATDTNTLGTLQVTIWEDGALIVYHEFMVVTANVWDTICSTDKIQSDLTQIGGVAQSATDLKDFADAGYNPATNKVTGVLLCDQTTLVDTTTTNTDMITAAVVNTQVDTALSDIDLDHFIQVTAGAEEPTDGAYLDQMMHKAVGQTFDATTDSLEAIRDNQAAAAPAVGAIADAVWDELVAGHVGAGSFGKTDADILADTNMLQTDWVDGGRLDLLIDAIKAVTDTLTLAAIADAVWDEVMDANAPANANSAREMLNVIAAVLGGKSSGGGGVTNVFRDTGDTKNRVSATVDVNGNRTAVGTLDGT